MKIVIAALCLLALTLSQVYPQAAGYGVAGMPADTTAARARADSALAASQQYRVIKKDVAVSEQVRIGTTVMVFIIVVMSFMNNFNPD